MFLRGFYLFLLCIVGVGKLFTTETVFMGIYQDAEHSVAYLDPQMNVGYLERYGDVQQLLAIPYSKKIYEIDSTLPSGVWVIDYSGAPKRSGQILLDDGTHTLIVVTPDGKNVYIACESPDKGSIAVVDTHQEKVVNTIDFNAKSLLMSLDGKELYAFDVKGMAIIDTASHSIKQYVPLTLQAAFGYSHSITPDGKFIYISGDEVVQLIDTSSYKKVAEIGIKVPGKAVFTSDGKWAYVSSTTDHSVSVIDTKAKKIVKSITLPEVFRESYDVMINKASDGIEYVYAFGGESIIAINTEFQEIAATLAFNSLGMPIVFSKDGSRLYAASILFVAAIDTDVNNFKIVGQTPSHTVSGGHALLLVSDD